MIRGETARDTTLNLLRTLHTCGMASRQKNAATRTSHFLELQRRSLHGKRTHYERGQTCDTLHIKKQGVGADTRRDTWALRNACSKQETQCFGPEFPMTSGRLWRNVAFVRPALSHPKPIGNVSDVPPHAWHTLGTDLFYWNKIDYLVIGDYFSKYLIIRRLPNSSTHAVIKELGLVFTELGRPFVLRSDNGPCYSSRGISQFPKFLSGGPHHQQPTLSTKQWIC